MDIEIKGIDIDPASRCTHYHSTSDIIAIKFKCCNIFYACFECHEALADHAAVRWPQLAFDEQAIYCGQCKNLLTVRSYLESGDSCRHCGAAFNPGCRKHHYLYFERSEI